MTGTSIRFVSKAGLHSVRRALQRQARSKAFARRRGQAVRNGSMSGQAKILPGSVWQLPLLLRIAPGLAPSSVQAVKDEVVDLACHCDKVGRAQGERTLERIIE